MASPFEYSHALLQRARELRKNPTPAEAVMWERVRNRRLGGYKFRRQHVVGERIVDFFCHDAQLIVEIDGEVHADPDVAERDFDRSVGLTMRGFRVLRYTNEQVLHHTDATCEHLLGVARVWF